MIPIVVHLTGYVFDIVHPFLGNLKPLIKMVRKLNFIIAILNDPTF